MRIETVTTSQVIAMNLRHRIYEATSGAQRWEYDRNGTRYARTFTPQERTRAAFRLGEALAEWAAVDPRGFTAWEVAMSTGDLSADPCAYCALCR